MGLVQVHVEPPPITLIKSKHYDKSDKDFVHLKLCRDLLSAKSDLYEFKIALFENGEPEEFLLFVCNFNMTLTASQMLKTAGKVQYLLMIIGGEALRQFYPMSSDMEGTNPLTAEAITLGLGVYFFLLIRYQSKSAQCAAE